MMSNSHAGNLLPDAYEITLGAESQKDEYGFFLAVSLPWLPRDAQTLFDKRASSMSVCSRS